MNEFKLEKRYIVLKIKDIVESLSAPEQSKLEALCELVSRGRNYHGKQPFKAIVIEQDWPEYEPALRAIEGRVNTGSKSELKRLNVQNGRPMMDNDSWMTFIRIQFSEVAEKADQFIHDRSKIFFKVTHNKCGNQVGWTTQLPGERMKSDQFRHMDRSIPVVGEEIAIPCLGCGTVVSSPLALAVVVPKLIPDPVVCTMDTKYRIPEKPSGDL